MDYIRPCFHRSPWLRSAQATCSSCPTTAQPNHPAHPPFAGVVHLYRHIPASVAGPGLKLVASQPALAAGAALLALHAGVLAWHLPCGGLHPQLLDSHRHLAETPPRGAQPPSRAGSSKWRLQLAAASTSGLSREERLAARCRQALELCHFERALAAATQLGQPALLREVAAAALQLLELPVAVAAYEAAGDEAALAQLRPLLGEADEDLVAGQLVALTGGALCCGRERNGLLERVEPVQGCLIRVRRFAACTRDRLPTHQPFPRCCAGDAERAEQLLLASSRPSAAIEMRRGLGHWERALELAEHLEPHALGGLALLRAQALETEGQVGAGGAAGVAVRCWLAVALATAALQHGLGSACTAQMLARIPNRSPAIASALPQVEAALGAYEQALAAPDLTVSSGVPGAAERAAEARAGLARCAILLGDVERGMELAAAGGSRELLLQCAQLLEGEGRAKEVGGGVAGCEPGLACWVAMKSWRQSSGVQFISKWPPTCAPQPIPQAGQLFARAGEAERAARLFLACREFVLLDGVMEHAGSPALWLQYAQAKEGWGWAMGGGWAGLACNCNCTGHARRAPSPTLPPRAPGCRPGQLQRCRPCLRAGRGCGRRRARAAGAPARRRGVG